ncbi:stage II sporulation protein P [Neobacillus thermocopriae]|uniref:Stage II sporulation protein P n=1 Tax=Neobacillus thermocopriae TaxID=1215031 RepID=A0A6B3TSR5_9BACI|nr:stage II sporulation protein P [Neobacillus thermocopriae]MED3624832.1 stage II sporulation protein P [Neobacillus thermocopriae]MED3715526.1 stage II sporulation protein P [Neobacillus thermocopriae]NEX79732.1 stage II sporulation protein P [Neobacillus thermocopriae]
MKSKTSGTFILIQGTSLLKLVATILLFLLFIFSISGILTSLKPQYRLSSASVNHVSMNVNGDLLYQLMGWENHHFLTVKRDVKVPTLTNLVFKLSSNINLDDPRSLLGRELPGFYQFDGKILVAGEGTNYTNMPIESSPPNEIMKAEQEAALQNLEGIDKSPDENPSSTPGQTTGDRKVVYVYFSHNRESFLPYLKGVTDPNLANHSQINVTKIGDQLKSSLEDRGIGTFVDKTDIQGNLNKKGLKYTKSYQESRAVVQAAMASNRDLTYFFDIHRDSRRKKDTTISINGQSYARLAFVIGGKNPNYEKNAKFASQLHDLLQKKYKGLSRGVIVKSNNGNAVYNQNLSENAILIEFGGVDNTFDELNRSADALADVFSEYYWQAENVNQNVEQSTDKQ